MVARLPTPRAARAVSKRGWKKVAAVALTWFVANRYRFPFKVRHAFAWEEGGGAAGLSRTDGHLCPVTEDTGHT